MKKLFIISTCLLMLFTGLQLRAQEDPYLWLEEVQGKKALEWVKEQNKESVAVLEAVPGFKRFMKRPLKF